MSVLRLPVHEQLRRATRLGRLASDAAAPTVREWVILFLAGAGAALLSCLVDLSLRIPGHAILRAVFPMAMGLALVPRRGAGVVMGCSALLTLLGLHLGGIGGVGLGATTSLAATGPLLDASLSRNAAGWRLYVGFIVAGVLSNLAALAVRGSTKSLGWEHLGARPLGTWLAQASVTYVLCGMIAGLISGAVWFCRTRSNSAALSGDGT